MFRDLKKRPKEQASFKTRWGAVGCSGLIVPTQGGPFPASHPFKLALLSSDAKPVADIYNRGPRVRHTVNVKLSLEPGNIYDMSLIERAKHKPLIVSKLKNGTYQIISVTGSAIYKPEDLKRFIVPLYFGGRLMTQKTEVDLSVDFDESGYSPLDSSLQRNDAIRLFLKYQKLPTEGDHRKILLAELFTNAQMKANGLLPGSDRQKAFLSERVEFPFFAASETARYVSVGSETLGHTRRITDQYDSGVFDPFIDPVISKRLKKEADTATKFTNFFSMDWAHGLADSDVFDTPFDHIFIRI